MQHLSPARAAIPKFITGADQIGGGQYPKAWFARPGARLFSVSLNSVFLIMMHLVIFQVTHLINRLSYISNCVIQLRRHCEAIIIELHIL